MPTARLTNGLRNEILRLCRSVPIGVSVSSEARSVTVTVTLMEPELRDGGGGR